jgi:hypothetical protein
VARSKGSRRFLHAGTALPAQKIKSKCIAEYFCSVVTPYTIWFMDRVSFGGECVVGDGPPMGGDY